MLLAIRLPQLELLLLMLLVLLLLTLLVLLLLLLLKFMTVVCTLPTPAPGAVYSRTGTVAGATAATIFAGGGEADEAASTATAPAAVGGGLLGAGAPCRRTSTATLSARRSHATPSLSAASVNS